MPTCKKLSGYTGDFQEAAECFRVKGNEHFKAKEFFASIKSYTHAIDIDDSNHVYYGNRSAAYGAIRNWQLAADDARVSVSLNSGYAKGFYRLAQALLETGEAAQAASAIDSGLGIDPENKEMAGLKRRISSRRNACGAKTRCKTSGGAAHLERLSLYDDKEGPEILAEQGGPDGDAQALRGVFRSLKDSVSAPDRSLGAGRAHELEGIFQKLTDPEQFRRIIMPGLQKGERKDAPSSLQELLRSSLYSSAVESSLPRVVARAASVLEAVKERGRKVGDVMDAATEEALKPQVLQEAFAREIVNVVNAVNAAAKAKAAKDRGQLASPSSEQASWDQLDYDTVEGLLEKGKGFAVQDSFLGEEWVSVLLEDSVRFQGTGKLGLRGVDPEHGEMAWVEPAQLEYGYPALHELVVNVHALTFELNLKGPRLRLSHPFRGSTMLLRLSEGCRFPERLDSFVESAETGYQVSAAYFIGRRRRQEITSPAGESQGVPQGGGAEPGGGELKLKNIERAPSAGASVRDSGSRTGEKRGGSTHRRKASDGQEEAEAEGGAGGETSRSSAGPREEEEEEEEEGGVTAGQSVVVEAKADRLVLFRSDRVSTQTLEVLGRGQEQYMLLFWMHGAEEDEEVEGSMPRPSSSPSIGDDEMEGGLGIA